MLASWVNRCILGEETSVSSFLHLPMDPKQSPSPFRARQDRLRALMETRRVPLMLLTQRANIRYLTGFTGSAAWSCWACGPEACGWIPATLSRRMSRRKVWR